MTTPLPKRYELERMLGNLIEHKAEIYVITLEGGSNGRATLVMQCPDEMLQVEIVCLRSKIDGFIRLQLNLRAFIWLYRASACLPPDVTNARMTTYVEQLRDALTDCLNALESKELEYQPSPWLDRIKENATAALSKAAPEA